VDPTAIFLLTGLFIVAFLSILAGVWYHHRKLLIEASLKEQMIERGMSAEEIKEVLQASLSKKPPTKDPSPRMSGEKFGDPR
jgi:hypothetical protein